jgi:hemerythrin
MDWNKEYELGIPELDAQHRQLLECLEKLEAAEDEKAGELAVYFVLTQLDAYSRVCFVVEEILMRLFDYPGLAAHAKEHADFAARLIALEQSELRHEVHGETRKFLHDWLAQHIGVSDRRFARFLLDAGAISPE